jgi:hypothetical protein
MELVPNKLMAVLIVMLIINPVLIQNVNGESCYEIYDLGDIGQCDLSVQSINNNEQIVGLCSIPNSQSNRE